MSMTQTTKDSLKHQIVDCLRPATEIQKIVVFGSFNSSDSPNDMDVAIFVDCDTGYLPLALKFRKMTRSIGREIALDIIPIRSGATGMFADEIARGEVIYER